MNGPTQNEPTNTVFLNEATREASFNEAQFLLRLSPSIQMLTTCETISRQLIRWTENGVESEVLQCLELEHPKLAVKAIQKSVQDKTNADSLSPFEIRQAVLDTLLPVLDINCQMQELGTSSEMPVSENANFTG